MDNEKPKLISMDSLLVRYAPFAKKDGENFTKKGLYNWRKNRSYPEPVITTPRLVWRIADVVAWEIEQGYDFL
ncbi:hypothetical protein [Photobacterium sanguinicancri]|uniref:hypothetical protein n=1 Tax=Photobacterium sanguinicancri TaxID=875932 RepID=UPI003D0EBCA7